MSDRPSARHLEALLDAVARDAAPPAVMGVLNLTPDSFSDGGRFVRFDEAVGQAERMIAAGADIIDVGPESTRPGSDPVGAKEQMARALPVIEAVRRGHPQVPISIDTRSAKVAEAALDAGADLVNDVTALRADPAMVELVAERRVRVVLMHMRGEPKTMQTAGGGPIYQDVVREVIGFLTERLDWAVQRGVGRERIIVDPGIGFGKTVEHNLQLMGRLADMVRELGAPLLVGASRKSFIGQITGEEVADQRVGGSLACATLAALARAAIVRAHDVGQTRQAVVMARAIRRA